MVEAHNVNTGRPDTSSVVDNDERKRDFTSLKAACCIYVEKS
jgi:hypothetical protein